MRSIRAFSNSLFWVLFAVYTALSVGMLVCGFGAVLASASPSWRAGMVTLGQSGGLLAPFFRAMVLGARTYISGDALQVTLDYLLSAVNLGFGLFLIARRPNSLVARLLAVAMIGTALAFNYQSHTVVGFTDLTYRAHFMLHAVSGAAYLSALLLFPDGRLIPRAAKWFLGAIYVFVAVEITSIMVTSFSVMQMIFGSVLGVFRAFDVVLPPTGTNAQVLVGLASHPELVNLHSHFLVDEELLFFVMFFGLLIPVVGIASQVYHYRALASPHERQQARFLLWALSLSLLAGVLFMILTLGLDPAHWTVSPGEEPDRLERLVFTVFPPIFMLIPVVLFVGILRLHLFDIDLVVNRSLVYLPLTGILAGLFAASIALTQEFFAVFTEQTSGPAAAVTTLIVVGAFEPLKNWLQREVDRHFREVIDPAKALRSFADQVRSGIWVLDVEESASRLLQVAVDSFGAEGGAVYLGRDQNAHAVSTLGEWNGDARLSLPLVHEGRQLGQLALGARRDGIDYTHQDRNLVQQALAPLAFALAATMTSADRLAWLQNGEQELRKENLGNGRHGVYARIPDIWKVVVALFKSKPKNGGLGLQTGQHAGQQSHRYSEQPVAKVKRADGGQGGNQNP